MTSDSTATDDQVNISYLEYTDPDISMVGVSTMDTSLYDRKFRTANEGQPRRGISINYSCLNFTFTKEEYKNNLAQMFTRTRVSLLLMRLRSVGQSCI